MRFAFLFFLIPAGAGACTVTANVGELTLVPDDGGLPDGGGTSSSPTTNDGGNPSGVNDAGVDGDSSSSVVTEIDAGCGVGFAQRASFIDVQVVMGAIPNPTGGSLVPGMYELISMRTFDPGDTGTMQVRETIRVRGSTSAGAFDVLTEARNATGSFQAYPLHGETKTYTVGGSTPSMLTKAECPKKAQFETQGRFEAKNDTLVLFDDENVIERVYRRVP